MDRLVLYKTENGFEYIPESKAKKIKEEARKKKLTKPSVVGEVKGHRWVIDKNEYFRNYRDKKPFYNSWMCANQRRKRKGMETISYEDFIKIYKED